MRGTQIPTHHTRLHCNSGNEETHTHAHTRSKQTTKQSKAKSCMRHAKNEIANGLTTGHSGCRGSRLASGCRSGRGTRLVGAGLCRRFSVACLARSAAVTVGAGGIALLLLVAGLWGTCAGGSRAGGSTATGGAGGSGLHRVQQACSNDCNHSCNHQNTAGIHLAGQNGCCTLKSVKCPYDL